MSAQIDSPPFAGAPARRRSRLLERSSGLVARVWRGEGTARSGVASAERLLLIVFALLRGAFLAAAVLTTATQAGRYRSLPVVLGTLVVQIGWSFWLIQGAAREGRYTRRARAIGDVVVAAVGLIAVGLVCPGGEAETWTNWMCPVALIAAIGAGLALRPVLALAGATLLLVAHLIGAIPGFTLGLVSTADTLGNTLSYPIYTGFALVLSRQLRRTGLGLDVATARAVQAETLRASAEARHHERLAQYHQLHDTVLATLTLIAQSALDPANGAVQQRAARDADYLRALVQSEALGEPGTTLVLSLAELVRRRQGEGMTVHLLTDALPEDLPREVVTTLTGAVREALTNVAKHAGTNEAWVTATTTAGVTRISVVDRGPGFDPDVAPRGRGLHRSIAGPLATIGGSLRLDSSPGEGTSVECAWPR